MRGKGRDRPVSARSSLRLGQSPSSCAAARPVKRLGDVFLGKAGGKRVEARLRSLWLLRLSPPPFSRSSSAVTA